MKKNEKEHYGLVCLGGGAHGAYQVGALKYIFENFSKNGRSPFQVVAGSSCGSINTTFCATHAEHIQRKIGVLEKSWLDFSEAKYDRHFLKHLVLNWRRYLKTFAKKTGSRNPHDTSNVFSLLDANHMIKSISEAMPREALEESLRTGATLGIATATTEINTGRTHWFVEGENAYSWNHAHSQSHKTNLTVYHTVASCSVPVFFPPVELEGHYYVDGSIGLSRPLIAAINMGAKRVISISTQLPYTPVAQAPGLPDAVPRLTDIFKMLIDRLGHDFVQDEVQRMNEYRKLYRELQEESKGFLFWKKKSHLEGLPAIYFPAHVYTLFPSRYINASLLLNDEEEKAAENHALRGKNSNFMFRRQFMADLMELGYQDTKAKHDEIEAFFRGENFDQQLEVE